MGEAAFFADSLALSESMSVSRKAVVFRHRLIWRFRYLRLGAEAGGVLSCAQPDGLTAAVFAHEGTSVLGEEGDLVQGPRSAALFGLDVSRTRQCTLRNPLTGGGGRAARALWLGLELDGRSRGRPAGVHGRRNSDQLPAGGAAVEPRTCSVAGTRWILWSCTGASIRSMRYFAD